MKYNSSKPRTEETSNPPSTVKDIPTISEVLHLCLEEALFLSYALGSLILTNEVGSEMNIDEMWIAFSENDVKFPVQYAVYHHFRCKGWVVKSGIKFGADWGKSLFYALFFLDVLFLVCNLFI